MWLTRVRLFCSLGVLNMCEMLTYWSLMHCFVVAVLVYSHPPPLPPPNKKKNNTLKLEWERLTDPWKLSHKLAWNHSYYDPETHGVGAKRTRRWTPSPTFINFIFLGFPICLVIAIICLFTWLSIVHNRFIAEAVKILDALGKGSFVWDQLKAPSASDEQKFQLTTQLLQIVAEAKGLSEDINIHSKHLISCLRHFQCALLMILSVTSLVSFPYELNRFIGIQATDCFCVTIVPNLRGFWCVSDFYLCVFVLGPEIST
jgi:hypothetical protein